MRLLGLSMSRSNGFALVVTLVAAFALGAILWSPNAKTQQSGGRSALPFPSPQQERPRDPGEAPARPQPLVLQPAPELGLRRDAAQAVDAPPIPEPKPGDRVWRRDDSSIAPSCQLSCKYEASDELLECGGYLDRKAGGAEDKPTPKPGCRKALYQTLQACMRGCGIAIPDLLPGAAPTRRP